MASTNTCRKYLLHFIHEHWEFKIPELLSIAKLFGTQVAVDPQYDVQNPFLIIDLPSEEHVHHFLSRSSLVKSIYELWIHTHSHEDLNSRLEALPQSVKGPYTRPDQTFKINITSFNRALSQKEKVQRIETVLGPHFLPEGKIKLSDPDVRFHLIEYYSEEDKPNPNKAITVPQDIYFARWIGDGQGELKHKYNLKQRSYIGNTSMDPLLSLIMSNMGQVKPGSLVFDPFVGTGSLLVACAHYGAYVMGCDIDYQIVHGQGKSSRAGQKWRSKDENLRSCLEEYGLDHKYLDVLVADSSQHAGFRQKHMFDAIITDPPYGIREPTKKIGPTDGVVLTVPDELKEGHIPRKMEYQLSDILKDLLNFAAKFLVLHGRLVYWLPVARDDYSVENVPQHHCLRVIANSEQPLNTRVGRRLITMEKVKHVECVSQLHSADVVKDHYGGKTFRDRYFRVPGKEVPKERSQSPSIERESDR